MKLVCGGKNIAYLRIVQTNRASSVQKVISSASVLHHLQSRNSCRNFEDVSRGQTSDIVFPLEWQNRRNDWLGKHVHPAASYTKIFPE